MIAALYVETNGCYFGLDGVDPWDIRRDARLYDGNYPVIAHPPCQRWGKMWMGSPSYVAKTGIRKIKGDDGGCFESALRIARNVGGVIEHPYQSHAFDFFGLKKPPKSGGWVQADEFGGYCCFVEQGKYGHWMRKPTWLLAYKTELQDLKWGVSEPKYPKWAIEKYGIQKVKRMGEIAFKGGGTDSTARIQTPIEFRDVLIDIARSAKK